MRRKQHHATPNLTIALLHGRASCRSFSGKKIEPAVLQNILEAGIHAPTGGNLQPYSVIKIEDQHTKEKLADMCGQDFMSTAPVNLLFCIDWHRLRRWAALRVAPFSATNSFRHFWISFQDTVIAAQNMCTAADALGLGSVYIGTILEYCREVREMFGLPNGVFPVVLLCLGYPKGTRHPRRKLGTDVVVHEEKYHEHSDAKLVEAYEKKYPDARYEVDERRLATIYNVCKAVHGEDFAKRCIAAIDEQGFINQAQRTFGLHYRADMMPENNREFLEIMEEYGFGWFKEFLKPGGK
jgi:FMN reductase [NAD(P)H]